MSSCSLGRSAVCSFPQKVAEVACVMPVESAFSAEALRPGDSTGVMLISPSKAVKRTRLVTKQVLYALQPLLLVEMFAYSREQAVQGGLCLQVGKDKFSMDFQSPMSALQAFEVCLTSFDGKLACE